MKKRRAKIVAGSLCGILAVTSPMQSIATTPVSRVQNGISYTEFVKSGYDGYSIVKADASALSDGALAIPEAVDGKGVYHLDSNFLSGSGARKVDIGKNVIAMSTDAFFEAKDLEEITSSSRAFVVSDGDPALYTWQYTSLLDYPSAASDGSDYTVNEKTAVIYSMDNAAFGRLDLGKADTLAKHALTGTEVSELALADNARTTTGSSSTRLSLPGLHAGGFALTSAGSGSYLRTDGDALYTSDGALIKLAADVEDGVDWGSFTEIDTDAFDSMAQYWALADSIPDSLKRDKVFHFNNQNNGVFIVNDQTAFCYNSSLHIPDKVTDSADFSSIIDGANYDKVNAVMFVGVPYDGTGLFEKTFGVSYKEAIQDAGMSRSGNAALNAVSSMIWELVDGKPSDIIDGVGSTNYFTEKNVQAYTVALRDAASHSEDYTFSLAFQIDGGILTFREQEDGTFASDPFKILAVDGNGVQNDSYKIQMTLSGDGFNIYGSDSMDFATGEEIILISQGKPDGQPISFTYEKGILKYYAPGSAGEQNLLVSGKKTESTTIQYTIEVKPIKEDLVLSKRAAGGTDELPGASLKLTDADGNVVDEWVSGNEPHTISMPEDGIYTLTEIMAPKGYEVAESITFTVTGGTVAGGAVTMFDAPKEKDKSSFGISKQDVTTNKELPGASLKLTDDDGETVDEWVSSDEPHVMVDLADGTYTLTETTAPEGYKVAESIIFTVKDGVAEGGMVVMYDTPVAQVIRKALVSKKDLATSKELPGASLKITDEDGNVADEWISSDEPHVVEGLADGTYTLVEVTAPDGYEVAESIAFTIKDGKVENGMVVMYDAPEKPDVPDEPKNSEKPSFDISKRDATTGKELPGASLKVTDEDGNVVDEWVSSDEPHVMENLKDGTYTLTETTAPNGYTVAESITFTVENGKIIGGKVVMYDAPEEKQKPSFKISKQDITNGSELTGAYLEIMDEDGDTIEEWVSSNKPHEIKGLPDGIYILTEAIAPNGYKIAESITFMIKDGTVEGGKIVMYDEPEEKLATPSNPNKPTPPPEKPDEPDKPEGSFYISKRDAATSSELPGAKLKLTDKDGNVVEEWTSQKTPHKFTGLGDGAYTLTEITAPQGYEVAESITFTIKDGVVENGTIVMYDKALPSKPSSSGGGSSGGGSHNSSGGDTTHGPGIKDHTEPTPEPVPEPQPEPQPNPVPEPAPSELPKTDDMPSSTLVFWATLLTLAGLLSEKKKYREPEMTVR